MNDVTTTEVLAVLILLGQLLSIYNSAKAAKKNASEPMTTLENRVKEIEKSNMKRDYQMTELKRDIDNAHNKIREAEESFSASTKSQNKALLAILLWIKDPEHSEAKQIDDAIKEISL
jgi:peptidoglycan hydrolase CwlO-like protein